MFFFSVLLNEKKKQKLKNKKIITYLTFFFIFSNWNTLNFFFSKVEQDQLRQYLTKFLNEFLKLKNVSNEVDTIPLVETIINIVPSINIFSFLSNLF